MVSNLTPLYGHPHKGPLRAGMLLDVKRWLPEHPGGSTIIPRQGLNHDCARFFEVRRGPAC